MNNTFDRSKIMSMFIRTTLALIVAVSFFSGASVARAEDPLPEVYTTEGSTNYIENIDNTPVAVDAGITVTGGSSDMPGAKVSITNNFRADQDVLVYTPTNGVTGSYNSATGVLTLTKSGGGNAADFQAAFRNIKYKNTSQNPDTAERTITFVIGANNDYFPDTNHYYRFIAYNTTAYPTNCASLSTAQRSSSVNYPDYATKGTLYCLWSGAKTEAQKDYNMLYGMRGYLATITSQAESDYIKTKVGQFMGWIGASDQTTEGDWRWVTGPEGLANGGVGTKFWSGLAGGSVVNPPDGTGYAHWYPGEPNNSGNEDYGHVWAADEASRWNDIPVTGGTSAHDTPAGFMVEYGDSPGDNPPLHLTAIKTITITPVNNAPTAIEMTQYNLPETAPEAGSLIGTFSTTDVDSSSYTYELVAGEGDTDNSQFIIPSDTNELQTVEGITYADGQPYSIRVRTTDDGTPPPAESFEQIITFTNRIAPGLPSTISGFPTDRAIDEDTNTGVLSYTIADGDTDVCSASMSITAKSSNLTLVPLSGITLGGSCANRTIQVSPAANLSGSARITVYVWDGPIPPASGSENTHVKRASFVLTVNPVDDPPTISNISDKAVNEDTSTIPIPFTVNDIDTDLYDPGFTVTGSSANETLVPSGNIVISGSGANRSVIITPALDQNGTSVITITANDGQGGSASDTFILNVIAVNDAPTITDIDDLTINGGTSTGALPFTIGDVDTAIGSLTLSKNSSNLTLVPLANIVFGGSGANRTVTVTPAAGQYGSAEITVEVSDGSLSNSITFGLTVNDPPVVATNLGATTQEGGAVTITSAKLAASDHDNTAAQLTFTIQSAPVNGVLKKSGTPLSAGGTFTQADINNSLITYQHSGNETTSDSFTFNLDDPAGAGPENVSFALTVTPVNDAPTAINLSNLTVNENVPIGTSIGTLTTTDVDNGAFTYSLVEGDGDTDNASFTISGDQLQTAVNLDYEAKNTYYVRVEADDGNGGTFADSFAISIVDVNDLPTTRYNTGITVGRTFGIVIRSINLQAMDQDDASATLTFTITDLPDYGTLKKNNVGMSVGGTFTNEDLATNKIYYQHNNGPEIADSFSFTISDTRGGVSPVTQFNITIGDNRSPEVVTNTGVILTERGQTIPILNTALRATDPDPEDTVLTYYLTTPPVNGDVLNGGVTLTVDGSFTQADIDSGKVVYQHNAAVFDPNDDFTLMLSDPRGGIVVGEVFQIRGTVVTLSSDTLASGSLRQIITDAKPGDEITFDPSLDSETIVLTAGQILLDKNLTISGPASISGNHANRAFEIANGSTVQLNGLTLFNGLADQGGVIINHGTTTISGSTLRGNNANLTGGAIYNDGSLTLVQTSVVENAAVGGGGGIHNVGTLNVRGALIRSNTAGEAGGGLYNEGPAAIQNVTFYGNTANTDGGGVAQLAETLAVDSNTFVANKADNDKNGSGEGGGIYGSSSATTKIINSLLADNVVGTAKKEAAGSITSLGFNMVKSPGIGSFNATGDVTNKDPKIGEITSKPGELAVVPLIARSPAIDAGTCRMVNGGTNTVDQRNYARPVGSDCDMGAAEFESLGEFYYDDRDPEFVYNPAWNQTTVVGAFSDTLSSTPKRGATVSLTFRGDRLSLFYYLSRTKGNLQVEITDVTGTPKSMPMVGADGSETTLPLELRGSSVKVIIPQYGKVAQQRWSVIGLGKGEHIMTLTNVSKKGTVSLDGIATLRPPVAATAGLVVDDEDTARIAYNGFWMPSVGLADVNNGTLTTSLKKGDQATLDFTGDRVVLQFQQKPGYGIVSLTFTNVNGGTRTVQFSEAGPLSVQQMHIAGLGDTNHQMIVTNVQGKRVNLDAVVVYNQPVTLTDLDVTVEDNQITNLKYEGFWQKPINMSNASGGTVTASTRKGDTAKLHFTGDRLTLRYHQSKAYGLMDVEITNVGGSTLKMRINQKGSDSIGQWSVIGLGNGEHDLTLTNISKKGNVTIDSITITGSTETADIGVVEDNQFINIAYQGYWKTVPDTAGNSITSSDKKGDKAKVTFVGQRLTLIYWQGASSGKMRIEIDGVPTAKGGVAKYDLDQKGSPSQQQWQIADLGPGMHSITMTNIGGGAVNIDSLLIADARTNTGLGTVEDSNLNYIAYTGSWQKPTADANASGGTYTLSTKKEDKAIINFTGERLTLQYWLGSGYGDLGLQIDGITGGGKSTFKTQINQNGSAKQRQWSIAGLGSGEHILTLKNVKGKPVSLDAVVFSNASVSPAGVGTVEDTSAEYVSYQGGWQKPEATAGASGGTITESIYKGDKAIIKFSGNRLTLVYWASSGYKTLGVRVENVSGAPKGIRTIQLDQGAGSGQKRWSVADLGNGEHTLILTNTEGGVVNLDAIEVSNSGEVATLSAVEDNDYENVAYSGTWQTVADATASGGTYTSTTAKGDRATLFFTGDRIALQYIGGARYGSLGVKLEGISGKKRSIVIDQGAGSGILQWQANGLGSGTHVMTLTNVKGGLVNLDAVQIQGAAVPAATSQVENTDVANVAYDGFWQRPVDQVGASGGSITVSDTKKDKAVIQFTGGQLALSYWQDSIFNVMGVEVIDSGGGVRKALIDQKGSAGKRLWKVTGLGSGTNTITLTNLKGGKVNFDAITTSANPQSVGVGVVEDNELDKVGYGGLWQEPMAQGGSSGGTITVSRNKGDKASLIFNGNQLIVDYWQDSGYGVIGIEVKGSDGKARRAQISQSGSPSRQRWIVTGLPAGPNVLTVTNKGGVINLDAIEVLGSTSTMTAGVAEDTNMTMIGYSGVWQLVNQAGASGNTMTQSIVKGDRASIVFYGSTFKLAYWQNAGYGYMDVVIRDAANKKVAQALIYQNGAAAQQEKLFENLGDGLHTVSIIHLKGGPVNIDRIEVH
jgi:hypothetical protein